MRALLGGLACLVLVSCGPEEQAKPTAASGQALFRTYCAICHAAAAPGGPESKVVRAGPNLFGVYGRPAGALDFAYSKALKNSGLVWDEARLDLFLANPQKLAPGTLMGFNGEPDPQKRRAIIDYLKSLN
ncbi:MAG: cytochrome c family protein [Amphiplicatus sp.]